MTDIYDKIRMVYAKLESEKHPVMICAAEESSLEFTTVEQWDAWMHGQAEYRLGHDWQSYSFIEVLVTVPSEKVTALFEAQELGPVPVERAPQEPS
jgi:hypothetical protein